MDINMDNSEKSDNKYKTPPTVTWKKLPVIRSGSAGGGKDNQTKKKAHITCTTTRKLYISHLRNSNNRGILKPSSLLSPLERIRIGIEHRANNFGLRRCLDNSFEANQSFPRINKKLHRKYEIELSTPFRVNKMDRIRVDGSNGLRFTAFRPKGCFTQGIGSPFGHSFVTSASESICRIPKSGINPNKAVFTIDSKTSQILIVNKKACELLGYTPKELCEMHFGNLLANKNKMPVSALAEGQLNSEDGTVIILSGKVVELCTKSGKNVAVSLWVRQIDHENRCLAVAESVERRVAQILVDKNGYIISGDYEALMLFQLDSIDNFNGMDVTLLIPALELPDADNSMIAKHIRKQKATGKTQEGVSFPLCLMISHHDSGSDTTDSGLSNPNSLYIITIWVFTNISGLLVIDENSVIESCNHHFSMLMFGFPQNKLVGEHISKLIPNFGNDCDYLGYVRSRNATLSSLDNDESETETDHVDMDKNDEFIHNVINNIKMDYSDVSSPQKEARKVCLDFTTTPKSKAEDNQAQNTQKSEIEAEENVVENTENNKNFGNISNSSGHILKKDREDSCGSSLMTDCDLLTPVNETSKCLIGKSLSTSNTKEQLYSSEDISVVLSKESSSSNPVGTPKHAKNSDLCKHLVTSTPETKTFQTNNVMNASITKRNYPDGKYRGEAIHYDGNVIDILYTVTNQILPCGRKVYCIWISRDPDSIYNNLDDEEKNQNLTLTFNSVTSTVDNSLGQAIKNTAAGAAQNSSRPNSVSLMSQCEEEQICGEYSKYYTTLKQIGKGAYGYVKMSYRNSDRLLVISKFILKEKLCKNFMVKTEDKEIPMEIYLLTHVKHPNIVSVYDVFENEKFFQLVMEVHGSGMDLFEFIDRRPEMTEKLGCYIFRQIANAVHYLHSLNILHRDIKDENIIIDHNFHVKLIDFGSATFKQDGKLFSTFYGTTEYCSPEVLTGNKYAGPELEMWSLGVTLFVLMFYENPFLDIEETLKAELILPGDVSEALEYLLMNMLDKNPKTRCTMLELIDSDWLNQEINPASFNFAHIVPCESYEVNPEKYYNGQIYASTNGLSTSPHSLSLVDDDDDNCEDSFIDQDEIGDDESLNLSFDERDKFDELSSSAPSISLSNKDLKALSSNLTSMSLKDDCSSTCISYINDKSISASGKLNYKSCDTKTESGSIDEIELVCVENTNYDDDSFEDDSSAS